MPAFTAIISRRISTGPIAALLVAAALGACSSNNNSGGGGAPVRIALIVGGDVSATVGTAIGPIVVRVTDVDTLPVEGVTVTFTVNGGATLSATSVTTDARGEALTSVTLSHNVGPVTVTANAAGVATGLTFQETGIADAPATLLASGGNNQTEPRGSALADPLTVMVTDQYGNPVSGVTITWTTTSGVLSVTSSRTSAGGTAQVLLTLPGVAGTSTVTASAQIGGTLKTATFTANAT